MPCITTQFIYPGYAAFLTGILGYFVKRIDIDIKYICILVYDPDGFLQLAAHFYFLQSAVYAHAVINMRNIISRLQFAESAKRKGLIFIVGLLYPVFVVALKYLVICIANHLKIMRNKSPVNGNGYR